MTTARKAPPVEVHAAAPPTTAATRSPGPDPLSAAQQTLGNRDFGRLVGAPSSPAGSESAAGPETGEATPVGAFVVEDDAETLGSGQMRRTAFLAAVRSAVCGAANEGFEGTGRTTDDCPWIEHWLGFYEGRDAAHLNRSLGKFAPETARATSATEAVTMIAARVRHSVDAYVATGEISGIPEGVSPDVPGISVLGGLLGGLLFKARPGGAAASADPQAVRARLGTGHPMSGPVRSRMEGAFGVSFSHVRLHRDGEAAALSSRLNARAFTVGEHVAFGAGEYRPGTVIGDALLAHELAHTLQQGAASADAASVTTESVETDADRSAAGAVISLWDRGRDALSPAIAGPRVRSGLRLSRCTPKPEVKTPDKAKLAEQTPPAADAGQTLPVAVVEEPPPDPEQSYWFQDPKKQPKEDAGEEMDFSRGKGKDKDEPPKLTTSAQQRQQVVADEPSQFSTAGGITVRFAYPASGFVSGKESGQIKSAKAAVLKALGEVVTDVANISTGEYTWEDKEGERRARAQKLRDEQQRARLREVYKSFPASKPLNVYLAPETTEETRTGKYYPITAQVWVNLKDVGDAAKLQTAMRLPLHYILGGPNPAMGGRADPPADMKRTMIHEGLHALLVNRGIDADATWRAAEPKLKLQGPATVQENARRLIRAYILAQEELFAYDNEESLYPVAGGPMMSGKPFYVLFKLEADAFFRTKKAPATPQAKKAIDVGEQVAGKKVQWEIVYAYPTAMALEAQDDDEIKKVLAKWPLK